MVSTPSPRPNSYRLLVLFVILAVVICAAGYWLHFVQRRELESEMGNQISAIADLKVSQLASWRGERIAEGRMIAANSMMMPELAAVLGNAPIPALRASAGAWLEAFRSHSGFQNAVLTDSRGRIALVKGWKLDPDQHYVEMANGLGRPGSDVLLTDFHVDRESPEIHLELAIPLRHVPAQAPFGFVFARIDPREFLYPYLQKWPAPHRTGETALVRRAGDEVLLLNDLRLRPNTAMKLRMPLSRRDVVSVQAALGRFGVINGIDHRGVAVLAASRQVPGTSWVVVAKIDRDELLAMLWWQSALIALLSAALIAFAGAGALLLWRSQLAHSERRRHRAEMEHQALIHRYALLSRYANDIILLIDQEKRLVDANDRAVQAYGYSREELLTMRIQDLRDPHTLSTVEEEWRNSEQRGSFIFETSHRRRDGSVFPVEASVSLVRIGNEAYRQSIIRDITERKQAAEKLRETLDKLRAVIEASPVAVVALASDGIATMWNAAAERMFGWREEEVLGRTLPTVPPEKKDEFRGLCERVLRGESFHEAALDRQRKDGSRIMVDLSTAPLYDEHGQVTGIVGVYADVTERQQAEEALRKSEERFRAAFEQAAVGMVHGSLDGHFLRVNDRFCEIAGYSRDELLLMTFSHVTHPADHAAGLPQAARLLVGEIGPYSMEKRYIRKDGNTLWVHETVSLMYSSDGRPAEFIVVVEDVSDRRKAERQQRLLTDTIAASLNEIYIFDAGTLKFRFANHGALQNLGYSLDEIRQMTPLDLKPQFTEEAFRLLIDPLLRREKDVLTFETSHRRANGATYPVEVHLQLFRHGEERVFLAVIQDVTERKRAEAERVKLEEQLLQAQKMEGIGRLAGGVAHDFNNNLTVINGYCDLLLAQLKPGDPIRERLTEVRTAGERAASLTQQLLAFSRKQIIDPIPLDLNSIIAGFQGMIGRLIGEDIELRTSLAPSIGTVMADEAQMTQALMNLAINARDAMPNGGTIQIETSNVELDESVVARGPSAQPGRYVLLSVSDTGCGMDQETQRHIFEPFYTTKSEGGTGLGLSTVYGIVSQAGGWIWVYSEVGKGTTFKIYLPVVDGCARPRPPREAETDSLRGPETILVVEDQEELRDLVVEILRAQGYQVMEAANGPEALMVADRHSGTIDLMITDVVMPGMTGRELADRISAQRPETRVLYVSGYPANVISRQGILDEAVSYLPKPFTPRTLAVKVREVLAQGG